MYQTIPICGPYLNTDLNRQTVKKILKIKRILTVTDMSQYHCHLMMEICSEKYVTGWFCYCGNTMECMYTNLDGIAYYIPRLYDICILKEIVYCSKRHDEQNNMRLNLAQEINDTMKGWDKTQEVRGCWH